MTVEPQNARVALSFSQDEMKQRLLDNLRRHVGVTEDACDLVSWRLALTRTARDIVLEQALDGGTGPRPAKYINYLSMEFLLGRLLEDGLSNLGLTDVARGAFLDLGLDYKAVVESEPDAALGNGGLGRLAACFLESMSTLGLPAFGYGIRYNHGLFKQGFEDGFQTEVPEDWLRLGEAWSLPRLKPRYVIGFGGRVSSTSQGRVWKPAETVYAAAHDWLIPGWGGKHINTLRLWAGEPVEEIDLSSFNKAAFTEASSDLVAAQTLSRVLYPDDSTKEGQALRLRQEYFFTSASLADIVARHLATGASIQDLPKAAAVQMNDTHPAIGPAELVRLLVDQHQLDFEDALTLSGQVMNYTNHTLLPEALETWPITLFEDLLPRHLEIIEQMDNHFLKRAAKASKPTKPILRDGKVHMGDLAFHGSAKVNGVSALHSNLMPKTVFVELNALYPDRIVNQTNGVTPRRWLWTCNPGLRHLINETIGKDWVVDLDQLKKLEPFADDPAFRKRFADVKRANKQVVSGWLQAEHGIAIDPAAMFDVHIKRIHEYKRQFLNLLETVALWNAMHAEPNKAWPARVKIFGGKAAPAYVMAKAIIKLTNDVARFINEDPVTRDRLKIVYPPNYNVSMAEMLIPAADLSEQISTAGKEASGTGNMKFAMNGALTIGTLDGANVEMLDRVGADNMFIFGNTAEEVLGLRADGYDPAAFIKADHRLSEVVDQISSGMFSNGDKEVHADLLKNLKTHDYFQVAADFTAYYEAQRSIDAVWQQPDDWCRRAILNVANMGYFSSDRTIQGYARDIWGILPQD